jgi:hypothetical protein
LAQHDRRVLSADESTTASAASGGSEVTGVTGTVAEVTDVTGAAVGDDDACCECEPDSIPGKTGSMRRM